MAITRVYHLIDDSPIRQSAEITVIDIDIGCHLPIRPLFGRFFRIIGVHRVELQSAFGAVIHRFLQQMAFTHGPQDNLVVILLLQPLQCLYCKRYWLAYLRIFMRDDRSVKIYCYNHNR